jgi:hypothetical protein
MADDRSKNTNRLQHPLFVEFDKYALGRRETVDKKMNQQEREEDYDTKKRRRKPAKRRKLKTHGP